MDLCFCWQVKTKKYFSLICIKGLTYLGLPFLTFFGDPKPWLQGLCYEPVLPICKILFFFFLSAKGKILLTIGRLLQWLNGTNQRWWNITDIPIRLAHPKMKQNPICKILDLAILSMIFGNLIAITQTCMKRMLAYSSKYIA